mmetsp:Transcript_11094/g.33242  ORF Transcript_11094/g.33242 Transcript_11094/m.33242 type:complete len:149 (-) Transcript_11094:184-630(-)
MRAGAASRRSKTRLSEDPLTCRNTVAEHGGVSSIKSLLSRDSRTALSTRRRRRRHPPSALTALDGTFDGEAREVWQRCGRAARDGRLRGQRGQPRRRPTRGNGRRRQRPDIHGLRIAIESRDAAVRQFLSPRSPAAARSPTITRVGVR